MPPILPFFYQFVTFVLISLHFCFFFCQSLFLNAFPTSIILNELQVSIPLFFETNLNLFVSFGNSSIIMCTHSFFFFYFRNICSLIFRAIIILHLQLLFEACILCAKYHYGPLNCTFNCCFYRLLQVDYSQTIFEKPKCNMIQSKRKKFRNKLLLKIKEYK